MIVSKITEILEETQRVTKYPPEVVGSVMTHYFSSIKDFLLKPVKAGMRIPYLGVIRTTTKIVHYYILREMIPMYKNNLLSKETFKHFWNFRLIVKKDEQRRDFKTRFNGEWHYPSRKQNFDSTGQS